MTRRAHQTQEAGADVREDRMAQADSPSQESNWPGPGHLHQQSPWLRWTVYLCAAIGMTLATLLLLRPPATPGNPQPHPSACGPCCR
jgi:hypothetical protein